MRQICFLPSAIALAGAAAATWPSGAAAQGREVVQALPSQASEELTQALSRLARSPRDLDALIAAGTASLELGDVDAAMGFFGRAYDLAPSDPRIKAGQAAAYVRTQRPVEALKLFEEAEAAGVEIVRLSGDYGLAYDLVGNNREAQARYRMALARRADDEVVRRLALSLAIAGDESGFEEALRPLLSNRDFGAYRTRAFGLAILGRADEAVAIAEAVMPRDMARRIEDYLRFMPRLTKAQQAAAGNLGIYPTAGRIGRDDPRIAALVVAETPPDRRSRNADEDLAPSGAPLGPRVAVEASSRAEVATELDDEEVVVATPSRREAERTVRSARREVAADPLSRTRRRPRIIERAATPTPPPPPPPPPPASVVVADAQPVAPASASGELPPAASPVVVATLENTPPAAGFDLSQSALRQTSAQQEEAPASAVAPPQPATVADAFADLSTPATPDVTGPVAGAVDIKTIKVRREVPPKPAPEPEPAKPVHPSRHWVQVATGKDRAALRFDWRRFSRSAEGLLDGKGPFVTEWGQTNRLLAGPYPDRDAARKALNALTEKGLDAFTFTSPEGQEIEELR